MSKMGAVALGGLLIGGFAIVALSSSKASAAEPATPGEDAAADAAADSYLRAAHAGTIKPADWQAAVAAVLATRVPEKIRAMASALEALGYEYGPQLAAVADYLTSKGTPEASRATKATVKEAITAPKVTTPPATKPKPAPVTKPKPAAKPTPTPKPSPGDKPADPTAFIEGQRRAQSLNDHLKATKKGKEDRAKVSAFQVAEGLTNDGKYGPKTALEIGSYGIVPVAVFYWPTDFMTAKKDYKAGLLQYAKQFPAQKNAFEVAAAAVKF